MKTVTVTDYLLARLNEIGVKHLFGVSGDYNLPFFDSVIGHSALRWVGCTSALNAACAADGYGRCNGAAALFTTSGMDELSALNGIAGSYAGYVPVIYIVGAPTSQVQQQGSCVHHFPGDGDFSYFLRIAQEVSAAQAVLTVENSAQAIDEVIECAIQQQRPGYLLLAIDIAQARISAPERPLSLAQRSVPSARAAFRRAAEQLLSDARRVSLLADFLADRWRLQPQLNALRQRRAIPCATLLMGKGVLDEQLPGYVGTWAAQGSDETVRQAIEEADVTIHVGVRFTDTLTSGGSQQFDTQRLIDLQPASACVAGESFAPLTMADALRVLDDLFQRYGEQWEEEQPVPHGWQGSPPAQLGQQAFWQTLQVFLQPGDIILTEPGAAVFGAASLRLPAQAKLLLQPLRGSVGYTLPAAFGAQTAAPTRRIILVISDAAAQFTIQELGSMMRDELHPIIFILNNQGYTAERAIHGATQRYNTITQWNWTALPQAFSLRCPAQSWRVVETVQIQEVMKVVARTRRLSLIEVVLAQDDLPCRRC